MGIFDKFKTSTAIDRLSEEKLYEQVAQELKAGKKREGIWVKAMAKSGGDLNKAESMYIELRVQAIRDEYEIEKTKIKLEEEYREEQLKQKELNKKKKEYELENVKQMTFYLLYEKGYNLKRDETNETFIVIDKKIDKEWFFNDFESLNKFAKSAKYSKTLKDTRTIVKKVFIFLGVLFFVILTSLLIVTSAQAAPQYGTVTVSKVNSVYDGDTFRVDINSLPPIVGKNIAIRVNGVDTPEIRGKCQYEKNLALEARDFVRDKLSNAKEIKLTNLQRGKYFRVVANVLVDGVSLEKELLDNKLAYEYSGGKKLNWCG